MSVGCVGVSDRIRWQSMPKMNGSAAATKADLEHLWMRIDKRFEQVDKRFQQIDKRFTNVDQQFKDMRLYFDITVESMHHDFRGAFGDRAAQYTDEVQGLSKRVGAIERRLRYSRY